MKFLISLEVFEAKKKIIVTLSDLNLSKKFWDELSQKDKDSVIRQYINDLPEQPYWYINYVTER